MPLTIPDKGEGDNDIQSVLFQEDIDVLLAGIAGIDCVLSGLAVTGGADMTPAVSKGAVLSNRVMFAVAAADVTISTAHASLPRIDLIVVNSSGALAVRTGTAAASPKPPARSANDVVIAQVYVPANATAIATSQCIDRRVTPSFPVVIYKTTTAETTNTTASAIHALNKSGSGVVIPNGLLLAGRSLRVRLGGNMLLNSGSTTVGVAVTYGGTTMFSDTSSASVNDTDRRAWYLDFDIVAQANNDQSLVGGGAFQSPSTAVTAPTTGIGDMWGIDTATQESHVAMSGSAAVDSDAGNRTLTVQITFSVSNTSVELVVEYATVELL
jgi:hypothetical protein